MRTDDLIHSMVADLDAQPSALARHWPWVLAAGVLVAAMVFAVVLGLRPDIASAAETTRFNLKIVLMLVLAGTAATLVRTLLRPGARREGATVAVLIAPAMMVVAVLVEMSVVPSTLWQPLTIGTNSSVCLTTIPLMAVPILAAILLTLRLGAPVRPGLTGAVAGLLAGSAAASLYALHCTDDSPLFVAIWYTLAIAIVMLVGAALGRLSLRW